MLKAKIVELQNDKPPVQGTISASMTVSNDANVEDLFEVSVAFSNKEEQILFLDWLEKKMGAI